MSTQRSRPDEEDLDDFDDLDDVLDQFSPSAQPPLTNANASTSASAPPTNEEPADDSDFAARLARDMESLLNELRVAPDPDLEGSEREQLAAAWERMLVEGMDAMSGPSTSNARTSTDASSSRPTESNSDFQSSIRSTVNRRRERESDLRPSDSSTGAGTAPDSLEALLSQWTDLDGDVPQGEGELQSVLEEMMSHLMSKDVLYEPLKELHEKFPRYLADHAATISPEDRTRYEAQISCIRRLIDEFEARTYRDDDERARKKIVDLMGELQTHGQPPEEIMGPLPPGFSLGSDGLPEVPDNCNTQ